MKAIVYENYGDTEVLQLKTVNKPMPSKNQVVVKIHATGLNRADIHLMTGRPFPVRIMAGFSRPKFPVLGADIAGTITSVGNQVTQFRAGDEVFADISNLGFGVNNCPGVDHG